MENSVIDQVAQMRVEQFVPDNLAKVGSVVKTLLDCLDVCEEDNAPIETYDTFSGALSCERYGGSQPFTSVVFTLEDGTKVRGSFEVIA